MSFQFEDRNARNTQPNFGASLNERDTMIRVESPFETPLGKHTK